MSLTHPLKKATFNFFQVKIPTDKNDFIGVVNDIILRHPDIGKRNVRTDDGFVRIVDWKLDHDVPGAREASGMLLRLRVDHNSRVAREDADDIRDLSIPQGYHLAEFFCFGYFEHTKTIIVHRNWYAGGHTRLSDYLNELYNKDKETLFFEPALSKKGMEEFEKVSEIYSGSVRVAVSDSNAGLDVGGYATADAVDLGSELGAAEITIRFTKGNRKRPLISAAVKRFVGRVLQRHQDNVKSAKFTGRANSLAEEVIVDLMDDRIVERLVVPAIGGKPSPREYVETIRAAYNLRKSVLEELYPQ